MGCTMENATKYHCQVDLSNKGTSHAQLIRLTGRNKKVLEVGPATGYITEVLVQRGCGVTCIEKDPAAAELARRREAWQPPSREAIGGYLSRYAALVTSASQGAVLTAGP